jgi:heptosyltransferase-2
VIEYDETSQSGAGLVELVRRLKAVRPATAILLRPTLKAALACLVAGIPCRVGTAYRYYSVLFTKRVKEHRKYADKHELDFNLNALRAVVDVDDRPYLPRIELDDSAIAYADSALAERGLDEAGFVIVHPGSGGSARNLPLRSYAGVADLIEHKFRTRVVVTGSRDETQVVDELESYLSGQSTKLTEIPRLLDLAAVIRRSRLFISGSTGPMHIAAAIGVPTLSFFSPVRSCSPRRWGPLGDGNTVLMPTVPECPTCKGTTCEYFDCMERISLEKTEECLDRILGRGSG